MSAPPPIISVVIPTYDRPALLSRCLQALAAESLPRDEFEVLVVDDGSATPLDGTVTPFCERLHLQLARQANAGPAAARNTGVALARGAYLAFTDDDCLPTPGWLASLLVALRAAPDCMVGGRVCNALTDNVCSSASQTIIDLVYAHYNPNPACARFFASNNMALPTAALRSLSGFAPTFRTSEDRDLCDRWLAAGYGLIYAPEAVVAHAHALSLTTFWRQHLGYGRGAYRYYRAHAQRSTDDSTLNPSFYVALVRQLPDLLRGLPTNRALALGGLMALWQVANLVGFVGEGAGAWRAAQFPSRRWRHADR